MNMAILWLVALGKTFLRKSKSVNVPSVLPRVQVAPQLPARG